MRNEAVVTSVNGKYQMNVNIDLLSLRGEETICVLEYESSP